MDASQLSVVVGIGLSLGFSYIPGLKGWFDALESQKKQMVMGASLVVGAGVVFGLACANLGAGMGISVACTKEGAIGFGQVLVQALIANQSVYLITKKPSQPVPAF